jgi:hypothetical protein
MVRAGRRPGLLLESNHMNVWCVGVPGSVMLAW